MNVPLLDISRQTEAIRGQLEAAFKRCLDHRGYCLGPEVEQFEAAFAEWSGVSHCVGMNSGTSALHIALRLLGIGPGDEVIVPAMTFASTAWAVSYLGAKPVFADVEADYFGISPQSVETLISEQTRAIIPVHLYGLAADMDPLTAIAERHSLSLVEDAAQAHGATYRGTPVGSIAPLAAFSFYPTKNLGACGEAGALTTADASFAARARSLRNHGSTTRYYHDEIGYNYRMEGLQAAALSVKLKLLSEWTDKRRAAAGYYRECLSDLPIVLPSEREGCKHVWHLFTILSEQRDGLSAHLAKAGIETGRHYPIPLHLQHCYADLGQKRGSLPVSESIAARCLSLPMFPEITTAELDATCAAVREFFAG